MSKQLLRDALPDLRHWGPWTASGGPDPAYDQAERQAHQLLLTDPNLLTCFRRQFPEHSDADYDAMVRRLDYVWDCPFDGVANVTGFRCGHCERTRAEALAETGSRSDSGM
jgi:hypothetical protein